MALLGTWIDQSNQTLGGGAGANFFQTVAHFVATIGSGLQGSTNPDIGLIVARSVEASSVPGHPYWFGANASIATLGLAAGSVGNVSVGIQLVTVLNTRFWSAIR